MEYRGYTRHTPAGAVSLPAEGAEYVVYVHVYCINNQPIICLNSCLCPFIHVCSSITLFNCEKAVQQKLIQAVHTTW